MINLARVSIKTNYENDREVSQKMSIQNTRILDYENLEIEFRITE